MISKGCKSIFPIQHQEIWDRYKQHVQAFWTPEEVSLQDDLRDLKTLNEGEKHFIKHIGFSLYDCGNGCSKCSNDESSG